MLSFKQLQEKKTKIKLNPKKEDVMEGDKTLNHGEDCGCMKCEKKRRAEELGDEKSVSTEQTIYDSNKEVSEESTESNAESDNTETNLLTFEKFHKFKMKKQEDEEKPESYIETKMEETEYHVMSKKSFKKLHKDFKGGTKDKPRATVGVTDKMGNTTPVSRLVKFSEAKVDQGKDDAAKKNERNQRTFGNRRDSKGSARSHEDTEARRYNTAKGRGVKMKGKKDKTPVNYHKKDSDKRVDALLKSMKEGVKRDEYGDIVGGPKISKKQKAKNLSKNEPDNKIVRSESAAWTRKAGKNKEGGLNEKGRKSYERENPGSDLKAPSKKVGNPRRKSFCARMRGMKKKLTSAKTARDPDSRINKSLRAWNCSYEWPKDKEMIETTSLKNEIIAKAQEKHKEAKQKKYKQIMDAGKAAKKKVGKDPRGVRALSKGKWGYVKNNQFTPD